MANRIGLFVKTSTPETGGTNFYTGKIDKRDLTLISIGGATPFTFAQFSPTYYTLYYAVINDESSYPSNDDPGQNTSTVFTITAPTTSPANQIELSVNGSNWFTSISTVPIAKGAFLPIYVRQLAGVATAAATLSVGTGSDVIFTSGTRLSAPSLSASGGDSLATLTIGSLTGESGFEIQRATDSNFTTNVTPLIYNLAADSTSYINNSANGNAPTNGNAYYYRVRGWNANGAGAWSSAASAVVLAAPTLSLTLGDTKFTATVGSISGATAYHMRFKLTTSGTWTYVDSTADGSTAEGDCINIGSGEEIVGTGGTAGHYTTALINAQQYDVQVRAVVAAGIGRWSDTSVVTPTGAGGTAHTLYFTDTGHAGSANLTYYKDFSTSPQVDMYTVATSSITAYTETQPVANGSIAARLYYSNKTTHDNGLQFSPVILGTSSSLILDGTTRSVSITMTIPTGGIVITDQQDLMLQLQLTAFGSSGTGPKYWVFGFTNGATLPAGNFTVSAIYTGSISGEEYEWYGVASMYIGHHSSHDSSVTGIVY